jgi:hypothetical protein
VSQPGRREGKAVITVFSPGANTSRDGAMTAWKYLIVALPSFEPPTHAPGASAAVRALNEEGERGWEAVEMTPQSLADPAMSRPFRNAGTVILE